MQELRKFVLPEIIFGENATNLCDRYALNFGSSKPLIVTDEGVISTGLVDSILRSLKATGIYPEVYNNVSQNPRSFQVLEGKDFYNAKKCDIIIGVGGGSPMDCAKAIGILVSNGETAEFFQGIDNVNIPGPPLICIPTTAGTSADISQFAIINDLSKQSKFVIVSKTLIPDVSLIDPKSTHGMDAYLTACTGIDALVHAIEAYVSNASSAITNLHALEAIRIISNTLVTAVEQGTNKEARNAMMFASMQAGMAFSNASLGIIHAMSHSLGGYLDLPHGECNALLLKSAVKANYLFAEEKYMNIARALGIPKEDTSSERCLDALLFFLEQLLNKIDIKGGLLQRGVKEESLSNLTQNAIADPCMVTNPRPVNYEITREIYEQSL